jgi:hypothetical protein
MDSHGPPTPDRAYRTDDITGGIIDTQELSGSSLSDRTYRRCSVPATESPDQDRTAVGPGAVIIGSPVHMVDSGAEQPNSMRLDTDVPPVGSFGSPRGPVAESLFAAQPADNRGDDEGDGDEGGGSNQDRTMSGHGQ